MRTERLAGGKIGIVSLGDFDASRRNLLPKVVALRAAFKLTAPAYRKL
ncbi:hypothetical protein [Polymorphobacter megasporae]|nr:hypothetical protein [Polymorphobacter megasporae]UAJ11625.1 hypothetical protein KTC28_08175 [Polymorphobacter megasporae]